MTGPLTSAEATALLELLENLAANRVDGPHTHDLRDALRKIRNMAVSLDPFPYLGSGPGQSVASSITTGVLAAQLDIAHETVRRLADAYSQTYGELPQRSPQSRARLYSLTAVVRITAAHQMMRDVPGTGALEAFTALRSGGPFGHPESSSRAESLNSMLTELCTLKSNNGALQARVRELQAEVARLQILLLDVSDHYDSDQPAKA